MAKLDADYSQLASIKQKALLRNRRFYVMLQTRVQTAFQKPGFSASICM
jgi:hypothetical protein